MKENNHSNQYKQKGEIEMITVPTKEELKQFFRPVLAMATIANVDLSSQRIHYIEDANNFSFVIVCGKGEDSLKLWYDGNNLQMAIVRSAEIREQLNDPSELRLTKSMHIMDLFD